MTTAREIHPVTPHLLFWEAYEPAVKCDLTSTALLTSEGLVLIDPIALEPASLLPAPPHAIVLTNANHARAAQWWKERTGALIYAPADAAEALEMAPDGWLREGEPAPGGLQPIALPGGALGETAYLAGDACCVGDALIHLPSHGFSLLPEKYCTDARQLSHVLRKLLSYDFRLLTFAHGTPLRENARERLAQLLA